MKTYVDLLLELRQEQEPYFRNYLQYAKQIKGKFEEMLGPVRLFIFGSVVKGTANIFSDIDLLVVTDKVSKDAGERAQVKREVLKLFNFKAPFEIHFANTQDFIEWYEKIIDEKVEV